MDPIVKKLNEYGLSAVDFWTSEEIFDFKPVLKELSKYNRYGGEPPTAEVDFHRLLNGDIEIQINDLVKSQRKLGLENIYDKIIEPLTKEFSFKINFEEKLNEGWQEFYLEILAETNH